MVRIMANRAKKIPETYQCLLPTEEISISSLLNTPLPAIASTANILGPAQSCVALEPPSWTEEQLKTALVPSKEWLMALDAAILEGWTKGIRSIKHPGNEGLRFPLWVGTFWTAISEVIREQREWKRAQEWVLTLPHGRETQDVQAVFDSTPQKSDLWMLPVKADRAVTKVSFFAELLSDGYLAERHIDAFVAHLNIWANRSQKAPGILVADLSLSLTLAFHHNAIVGQIQTCTPLLQYTALFKQSRNYHTLLFPAHVGGLEDGHWVVFCVDFKKCEYSFGEFCGGCK